MTSCARENHHPAIFPSPRCRNNPAGHRPSGTQYQVRHHSLAAPRFDPRTHLPAPPRIRTPPETMPPSYRGSRVDRSPHPLPDLPQRSVAEPHLRRSSLPRSTGYPVPEASRVRPSSETPAQTGSRPPKPSLNCPKAGWLWADLAARRFHRPHHHAGNVAVWMNSTVVAR